MGATQAANHGYRKVNGNDSKVKKKGLMVKVRGMRDGLSDRIPQQHEDTAHDHLNRGKQFQSRNISLRSVEINLFNEAKRYYDTFFTLFHC